MSLPISTADCSTSSSLLESARDSLPDGWVRLNTVYGPIVYRWCRKAGVPESDAADVVQEVFGSLLKNLNRFRKEGQTHSFRAWVRTITRNKIVDYVRRENKRLRASGGSQMRQRLESLPADASLATTEADDGVLTDRVLQLIQRDFDEKTWRAFWQSTVEGLPVASIAHYLGMTKGAVRQAKYRVLCRLRDELAEWE